MRNVSKWAVSIGIGAATLLLQVLLVDTIVFALATGLVYGCGARLVLDNPAGFVSRNENYRTKRIGLVAGSLIAYLTMLTFSLSLPQLQQVGVAILFLGSMMTMWLFGSTYERAKSDGA